MTTITIRNKFFSWGTKTYLMGILNVTPDSFSDGGDFNHSDRALIQVENFINSEVDIIDIGGQSTRPGAEQISLDEELNRVIPVIKSIRKKYQIPISIDTTRAEVARLAIESGADIVNDISAGTYDPEMLSTVARLQVPYILMHIKGTPKTMQSLTDYQDLIGEICSFLEQRIKAGIKAGISTDQMIIDPGIGFAKNFQQNIEILKNLQEFQKLGCPVLVGVSRKSFIGQILNQPEPKQRIWGTAAACTIAIAQSADILRIHDVAEIGDVAKVADRIYRS
jgi:dihydropteroate synthase